MKTEIEIALDGTGWVVANKPSGMLSEGGGGRELDLERAVGEQLGRPVWCCHRLDRPTSGVVVLRKGKRYTKELARQFEGGLVRKEYWLLLDGQWDKALRKVESRIAAGERPGVYANVSDGGKVAKSTFQWLAWDELRSVSALKGLLKTGRTHQLRLHALKGGCPILGDSIYGESREDGLFGLHARSVRFRDPASGQDVAVEVEPPGTWASWRALFGG